MIVITDILKEPLDEGAKVATFHLLKQVKQEYGCIIFSVNGDRTFELVDNHFLLNKMFFSLDFYKRIKASSDEKILYIPEASITLASIIRARFLKIFTGKKVAILSFQPRRYSSLITLTVRTLRPDFVITQSIITSEYLKTIGIETKLLSLGVDDSKYKETDKEEKKLLREKYAIDYDKTVLLHVGHIQKSRNVDWLLKIKSRLPDTEVIMVGSTYSSGDEVLHETLVDRGIVVMREYLPNIEEIYSISDFYVFPVLNSNGAIETPLSVLEAMACNLPVISTRFGSLPDVFAEDECFHFVNSCDEVIDMLKNGKGKKCNNRSKVKPFTWGNVARQLVEIMG